VSEFVYQYNVKYYVFTQFNFKGPLRFSKSAADDILFHSLSHCMNIDALHFYVTGVLLQLP
jgi:hypothetical protein